MQSNIISVDLAKSAFEVAGDDIRLQPPTRSQGLQRASTRIAIGQLLTQDSPQSAA